MKYTVVTQHTPLFDTLEAAQAWVDRRNGAVGEKISRVARVLELSEELADTEKAYVEGGAMARRLLRLQLGLAVPEDRL